MIFRKVIIPYIVNSQNDGYNNGKTKDVEQNAMKTKLFGLVYVRAIKSLSNLRALTVFIYLISIPICTNA